MAWLKERAKKIQVGWRDLAGKERWRTCSTRKDAKKLRLEIESTLSRGQDWEPEVASEGPLVSEVAEAYIRRRKLTVRPDTLRMDATYLDVFTRFLGTKSKRPSASMLSKPLLDEYLEWLARPDTSVTGTHERAPVTIAKFVRAAQQMWVWAEDSDRWPGQIPRPRVLKKSELPHSAAQPVVAPSWDEMDAVVHASKGVLKKLAIWLRYSGLRSGESMLFTWADVDLERGELTIRPEVDKNGIGRVIPLSPLLLAEIKTWRKREVGAEREGYILPSGREPGPREREARGRDMARAWKRTGAREAIYKRRPDHAFRKGLKSGLLGLRAHADAVDFLQGHSLGAGSRGKYIDPAHLPLRETVALIPAIAPPPQNVVTIPKAAPARKKSAGRVRAGI